MLYLYWPGKYIPEWLENIRFRRAQIESNPYIAHGGFGIVAQHAGCYHVKILWGPFIIVKNCNNVDIIGGNKGVYIHSSFITWGKALLASPKP